MVSRRAKLWKIAEQDLGVKIEAPFQLTLPDGTRLAFDVLVKEFGGDNGTVLVDDFLEIKPYVDQLARMGFGYSAYMQPPASEVYNREGYIELLRDWGWTG